MEEIKEENTLVGAKDKVLKFLKDFGCQHEIDEDGSIFFKYQGENLKLLADNERDIIRVLDLFWYDEDLMDPECELLIEAVNEANQVAHPKIVYVKNQETGKLYIHSYIHLYVPKEYPFNKIIFENTLDVLIEAHRVFWDCLNEIKAQKTTTSAAPELPKMSEN